jgi:hypothetical protein
MTSVLEDNPAGLHGNRYLPTLFRRHQLNSTAYVIHRLPADLELRGKSLEGSWLRSAGEH